MTLGYVLQSLRRRPWETLAATVAVALTVAFLASLGSFVSQTGSKLTLRAAGRVPVDWQVQSTPGSDPAAAAKALRTVPGLTGSSPASPLDSPSPRPRRQSRNWPREPGIRSLSHRPQLRREPDRLSAGR